MPASYRYAQNVTAKGVPVVAERCGKWMAKAGEPCAMPENHNDRCRTAAAMAKHYRRNNARRRKLVLEHQAWVDQYKLERGCIDCGYADHPVALDFDHRDPELKTANVSSLMWATIDKIRTELDKCDVRCACCHRIKTYLNRRRPDTSKADTGPSDEI